MFCALTVDHHDVRARAATIASCLAVPVVMSSYSGCLRAGDDHTE
jgi:hypothetical protein